ncbi:hypothetical protein G6F57_000942 [Rhizopus arrhizus]|nr:hypothetical protein G6F30_001783 [Rhizopus arrhizus]KAG0989391.1 hypothetical protein G6F29_001024 [Rhizopus arrhizus]KAG0996952.1 hypothetical protein G6F28_003350 [Rhizopus arrhizus]KAG1010918.1 hypothetical protein G6F27_004209 [Rhizopus arrhizus]KAG1030070.1 hypothetical protein G6F26_001188 [Rhizopus arrhizus]
MGALCCKEEPIDSLDEVELSHFQLLRSVGRGAFGKVRVVQHKGTKKLYALKYINKDKCIEMKAVENIISERRLLERIDHNLIVNLRYAFQDDEHLFMVLDLMLGGDLRFRLDRLRTLPERYVQFYAAELSSSIHYLHSQNIVHRDIKPDNVLLDERGHVHLTDFNIAVQFRTKQPKPLMSVAGSMAYIAPEILQKQGYTFSIDWWSLGVLLYELLYGKRPFRGKSSEGLQRAILADPIHFPPTPNVSADAIDFIQRLLTRDITQRIGVEDSGFERLKRHPWLKDTDWDLLDSKTTSAPFIPDGTRSNFDPTHELEEVLLEDKPLKAKKKTAHCQQKKSMSKEELAAVALGNGYVEKVRLEQKFLLYDYTKSECHPPLPRSSTAYADTLKNEPKDAILHDSKSILEKTVVAQAV